MKNMEKYFLKLVFVFGVVKCVGSSDVLELRFFESLLETNMNKTSQVCSDALNLYFENLNSAYTTNQWALEMWDASSKLPVGLLSYNFGEMGNFDQCIKAVSVDHGIKGKYCLGQIAIQDDFNLSFTDVEMQIMWEKMLHAIQPGLQTAGKNPTWAICLPSNCSNEDIMELLSISERIGLNFRSVSCQTWDDANPPIDNLAILGMVLLAAIVYLMIVCTSYDVYCKNTNKKPVHPTLILFSVYTNGKKLFEVNKNSRELPCLHGIRVLSMLWIIAAHNFSIYPQGPVFNSKDFVGATDQIGSMVLAAAPLACDTFLLVAGTLVVYVFFKYNGFERFRINIFQYYLHRYIRVTPVMAGAVLVSATLLKYMGSGPTWFYVSNVFGGNCRDYWWSALLYVQNYVNVNKMCVGNSWYLDIDWQLYLLSPIFLYLLMKYPKVGFALIAVLLAATTGISFYIAYSLQLSGITTSYNLKASHQSYMDDYYLRTHTRAGPWLLGLILGYILVKDEKVLHPKPKINKIIISVLWVISLVTLAVCMFGGHSTLRGVEYDRLGNSFYIALIRPAWSLGLAWIIWACAMNYGGAINTLLSLPIFQVFNRFTYSMYIIHVTLIYMIVFGKKMSIYLTVFDLFYDFLGLFTLVFLLSIIWVLAFESPIIVLEKMILSRSLQR